MSERLLASVHGVSSDARRLSKLVKKVAAALKYDDVVPINYGEQKHLKAVDRQTRFLIFNNVSLRLREAREVSRAKSGGEPTIDVIAHSFGTLAIHRALTFDGITISRLILLGCIMDRWVNWDPLVAAQRVQCPPLNIVRPFDMVVRQAHFVGGDRSGSRGFSPNSRCQAIEHFTLGGHNEYADDQDLIIGFLGNTLSGDAFVDEESFQSQLSLFQRVRLRMLRTARLL